MRALRSRTVTTSDSTSTQDEEGQKSTKEKRKRQKKVKRRSSSSPKTTVPDTSEIVQENTHDFPKPNSLSDTTVTLSKVRKSKNKKGSKDLPKVDECSKFDLFQTIGDNNGEIRINRKKSSPLDVPLSEIDENQFIASSKLDGGDKRKTQNLIGRETVFFDMCITSTKQKSKRNKKSKSTKNLTADNIPEGSKSSTLGCESVISIDESNLNEAKKSVETATNIFESTDTNYPKLEDISDIVLDEIINISSDTSVENRRGTFCVRKPKGSTFTKDSSPDLKQAEKPPTFGAPINNSSGEWQVENLTHPSNHTIDTDLTSKSVTDPIKFLKKTKHNRTPLQNVTKSIETALNITFSPPKPETTPNFISTTITRTPILRTSPRRVTTEKNLTKSREKPTLITRSLKLPRKRTKLNENTNLSLVAPEVTQKTSGDFKKSSRNTNSSLKKPLKRLKSGKTIKSPQRSDEINPNLTKSIEKPSGVRKSVRNATNTTQIEADLNVLFNTKTNDSVILQKNQKTPSLPSKPVLNLTKSIEKPSVDRTFVRKSTNSTQIETDLNVLFNTATNDSVVVQKNQKTPKNVSFLPLDRTKSLEKSTITTNDPVLVTPKIQNLKNRPTSSTLSFEKNEQAVLTGKARKTRNITFADDTLTPRNHTVLPKTPKYTTRASSKFSDVPHPTTTPPRAESDLETNLNTSGRKKWKKYARDSVEAGQLKDSINSAEPKQLFSAKKSRDSLRAIKTNGISKKSPKLLKKSLIKQTLMASAQKNTALKSSSSTSNLVSSTSRLSRATPVKSSSTPNLIETSSKSTSTSNLLRTPSGSSLQGTTASRSKVKPMPNFAKIHQQAFDKMESLQDYSNRKKERAKLLLSTDKSVLKENTQRPVKSHKQLFVNNEPTKTGYNRFGFKINKTPVAAPKTNSSNVEVSTKTPVEEAKPKPAIVKRIPRHEKKIPVFERKNLVAIGNRMNAGSVQKNRENRREVIKGVRSNRRFDLLMKMRSNE